MSIPLSISWKTYQKKGQNQAEKGYKPEIRPKFTIFIKRKPIGKTLYATELGASKKGNRLKNKHNDIT